MTPRWILAAVVLGLVAPGAHAQRVAPLWTHAAAEVPATTWLWSADAEPGRRTYQVEGAVIGAVVVGFLGAVTGIGLCHFDAPCRHPVPFAVGGFALGALAGVGLGGWLGASVPKR